MKFSIQEEGHPEKQIFFTFKEASAQTGLPSKVILRVLQSGQNKYVRRVDKKVFWIREDKERFIQIDGEDFFTAEEIQERFGLSRTVFFNQLQKKKTHFLDSQEKSHEVTWKSPLLDKFLNMMNKKAADEKFMSSRAKKGMCKIFANIDAEMNSCIENCQALF